MKLFDEEFHVHSRLLSDSLHKYYFRFDMGVGNYVNGNRVVATKYRMRKDRNAVISLTCLNDYGDIDNKPNVDLIWQVTTSVRYVNKHLVDQLLKFLETGERPTCSLPTYMGYDDLSPDGIPTTNLTDLDKFIMNLKEIS